MHMGHEACNHIKLHPWILNIISCVNERAKLNWNGSRFGGHLVQSVSKSRKNSNSNKPQPIVLI